MGDAEPRQRLAFRPSVRSNRRMRMVLLGFGRDRASPPKRGFGSLFRFIFPAIKPIRSNPVTSAGLRDVPALSPSRTICHFYLMKASSFSEDHDATI